MKLLMPKQHGAWAMLLVPFLLGMIAGGIDVYHLPLFLGWFLLYLATNPFILLVKKKKISYHFRWFILYIIPALLLLLVVVFKHFSLFYIGISLIPFFLINIYYAKQKNERAFWNDISAIIVFCIGGIASYFVGSGTVDGTAWLVFLLSFLFFVGSTFYVKTMIREKKNRTFKWLSWGYHLAVLVGLVISGLTIFVFAFVPSAVRAVYFYGKPLTPIKIGVYEIINSAIFFVGVILFI